MLNGITFNIRSLNDFDIHYQTTTQQLKPLVMFDPRKVLRKDKKKKHLKENNFLMFGFIIKNMKENQI